jgi:transposase
MAHIAPEKVFYLDESGFDSRTVGDSGWAARGQRLSGKKEGKRAKVRQSVVALRNHKHKLLCAMVYEGTMKKERFSGYLEKALRVLPKGSVIVLDNASCHKALKIEPILAETESDLLYLPPYSPELNPIERIWSCVKTRLKKIYRYMTEDFFEAICTALSAYADPDWAGISF